MPSSPLATSSPTPVKQTPTSPLATSGPTPHKVMAILSGPKNDLSMHLDNALRGSVSFQSTLLFDKGKYVEISELREKFLEQEKGNPKGMTYSVEGSTITVTHFHGNSASQEELEVCLKSQKAAFRTFKPLLEIVRRSDQLALDLNFNFVKKNLPQANQPVITYSHKRTLDDIISITPLVDKTQNHGHKDDIEKQDSLSPLLKKPRKETQSNE
ncbi:hypothetical protein [Criblamydia sequanensis]|nr:hypothetical protein [Criblamydia sequanensis]